jgi:DNA repair exonuclease SbcCD ATPase subunit
MAYEKDDTTGLWDWIGDALDSPGFLKTRLAFGIVVGVAATALFTYILFQMERHNATYKAAAMEAAVGERDTQLELEEDDDHLKANKNGDYVQAVDDTVSPSTSPKAIASNDSDSDSIYKPGDARRHLNWTQRTQIIANVAVLILFNYLLLVFKPGSVALSFFAMAVVWVLALHSYLRDELRRSRYDRFITMIALFFILAGCLTLITYCRLALREGSIYEGPARIVGYNDTVYNNKDGQTLRTDLEVSWGGSWGCPDEGGSFCKATVQGALCETKYNATRRSRRSWARRTESIVEEVDEYQEEQERAEAQTDDDKEKEVEEVEEEASEEIEEVEEEDEEEIEEVEDEANEAVEEQAESDNVEINELSSEVNAEAEEVEVVKGEVTAVVGKGNSTTTEVEGELVTEIDTEAEKAGELESENEELEQDLEQEEEYASELEDEIEEDIEYSYDDEVYEDDYWQQDWDSVWGEYACEDLFDSDLSGEKYDSNTPPGKDKWPTVMIFGSCNSCEAYIQDYYSSEHFQSINSYEFQSWLYLWLGFFFLALGGVAAIVERVRPTKDNKVVLLSYDGGVQA